MVSPSVDGESTGCLAMQTQLNHDSGRRHDNPDFLALMLILRPT